MHNKVARYLEKYCDTTLNQKLLVGVSGGVDSIVLLHILHRLGVRCVAAHCNFKLRGSESDADLQFVADFANQFHIPFISTEFDTQQYAREHSLSIEMAARELRYNWFAELMNTHDCDLVAVGHHLDDSVETFFLNLLRGSGVTGLSGIQPRHGKVIRPLLGCTRQEVDAYALDEGLSFRVDASNLETLYLRNKIRHDVLPLFKAQNPSFLHTMSDVMSYMCDADSIINEALERFKRLAVTSSQDKISISIPLLLEQPGYPTLLYRFLSPYGFNSDQVVQLVEALHGNAGKGFESPRFRLLKDRECLIMRPHAILPTTSSVIINALDDFASLPIPISAKVCHPAEVDFKSSPQSACFDADLLTYPLQLRKWQRGDRFAPFGMKGTKKVSDLLTDLKLSRFEKEEVWVLANSNGAILWVVGLRTDRFFAVSDVTTSVLRLVLSK